MYNEKESERTKYIKLTTLHIGLVL